MQFAEPEKNVKELRLREDAIVADLGTGSGWYALATAKVVPRGKVYAIDVQKDFLDRIKSEALSAGLQNIETIWADIERVGGTKLADNSLDAVVASNVIFQLADRITFSREVNRILKSGGKLLVVDWSASISPGQKIFSKSEASDLFYGLGFSMEKEFDAGVQHYGLIFRKP